jgi:DNA polymerase III alpha subunit
MDDVPLDDPAVYDMLARGGTSGVFQFESTLATEKLRSMRCDRFEDLVATNALIRPGPLDAGMTDVYIRRKLGQEAVTFPHPDLEETLDPTYGIIVYQEQVMRIANVLAEFTLGEADVLRKAVGKKNAELIAKELGKFTERCVAKGRRQRRRPPTWPSRSRPSVATASTSRTRRRTRWSPITRPGSRPTTRPSSWPGSSRRCSTRPTTW